MTPELADSIFVVDWEEPADQLNTFGAVITAYIVEVETYDGAYYDEVYQDCPSTSIDLLTNTQCTIQVSTIRGYPWHLSDG